MVMFVEVCFEGSFEGMGILNVTDVRRERIIVLQHVGDNSSHITDNDGESNS